MIVNPPENAIAYPAPVVAADAVPAQQGLDGMFPTDRQEESRKRGSLAGLGALGGAGVSTLGSTLTVSAPEVVFTTLGGLICSAPTSSSVDCARGEPVNTTLGELMGKVKEGYRDLKEKR